MKKNIEINLMIIIASGLIIGAIAFVFYKNQTYHQFPLFEVFI